MAGVALEVVGEKELIVLSGGSDWNSVSDFDMSKVDIPHARVGGVLDHSWTFWVNRRLTEEEVAEATRDSRVKAELGDLLSTTTRGTPCRAPAEKKPTGDYRWREEEGRVITRCVFSPTGWVDRYTTIDEIMDVYDIQRRDRLAMQMAWGENKEFWPRPFTRQIPVRVLVRCMEAFVLARLKAREDTNGKDQDGTVEKMAIDQGKKNLEKENEMDMWEGKVVSEILGKSAERIMHSGGNIPYSKLETKNDDAQARVEEWNRRACQHLPEGNWDRQQRACEVLRRAMLRRYKHYNFGVIRSFRRFMCKKYGNDWLIVVRNEARKRRGDKEIGRDFEVGMDAIRRALNASFWDWEDGSTVFFWRWPVEFQAELRDGMQIWYRKNGLPSYWGRQRWPRDVSEKEKLKEKISKVLARRYVSGG
jgi:hypothetical protein